MNFETADQVTLDEYMEMIRLKTSLLLGYALKIGAILGGADKEDQQNLYAFGEKIGLAFQLQDDWLDVYGDPKKFQKKLGGDIVDNKKTFMLIKAYQLADNAQKAELDKWMTATEFQEAEKIAAVTHIYNIVGIGQHVQKKIEELFSQALACLEKVKVNSHQKDELRHLADQLLGRQY